MSKAFRFSVPEGTTLSTAGVPDDVRALVRQCREKGTHGAVSRVDFRSSSEGLRAHVTMSDGRTWSSLAGSCRLHNLLVDDLRQEDARRAEFRTTHPWVRTPSPNGDERFAFSGPAPLDADLAHRVKR